ncbi:alpha-ketoglutarate-dependent dioxygenase alkB homolog 7, mitochondrial isoform X1 [Drosophila albomicans]|uniref:Alpha-ketoglutarate-dependent dioxygenase alkB homolog 7, mitochondrial isoform X1 n=2 Tax=Drosophila albomicans TaxID=7291 RepID=A0A6P8Y9J3_DROAB|nr:alpha-ketoglutarate-dependent dioxygenase alkB homolog 7, mitochondrial isoform X1 [Drosophila albomicans]
MVIFNRSAAIGQILRRCHRAVAAKNNNNKLTCFHGRWPTAEQRDFEQHMRIIPDFISEAEEQQLHEEVEPYMSRLRYEFDHWDDAIHGFRETERKKWYPSNREVLERVRQAAFEGAIMSYVHVLDLAADGVIKPHVDSTRYCGNTISGISLLSDSVMRLVRTSAEKYQQGNVGDGPSKDTSDNTTDDAYRHQPEAKLENNFYADILLPRRSLYIMSHSARYNFTHEILAKEQSQFLGNPINKTRRISIICRNDP